LAFSFHRSGTSGIQQFSTEAVQQNNPAAP
jgi:hypothetical protein